MSFYPRQKELPMRWRILSQWECGLNALAALACQASVATNGVLICHFGGINLCNAKSRCQVPRPISVSLPSQLTVGPILFIIYPLPIPQCFSESHRASDETCSGRHVGESGYGFCCHFF